MVRNNPRIPKRINRGGPQSQLDMATMASPIFVIVSILHLLCHRLNHVVVFRVLLEKNIVNAAAVFGEKPAVAAFSVQRLDDLKDHVTAVGVLGKSRLFDKALPSLLFL